MRSLRTKILILVVCVVVLAQAFTVSAILYNAKEKSTEQAYSNLKAGVRTVGQFIDEHSAAVKQLAYTLVSDDDFQSALEIADPTLILTELEQRQSELPVNVVLLTDADGVVLFSSDAALAPGTPVSEGLFLPGELFTSVIGERAFEMMAAPLQEPYQSGYLVLAILVDDQYAAKIQNATGLQASFTTDSVTGRLFLGSSLEPLDRALMLAGIEEMRSGAEVFKALDEVSRRFVSTRTPFISRKGHVYLLMHQSLDLALAPYKSLQVFISYLVTGTLLVVCVLVWFVSTRLTRPVHQLSEAVQRITIGDYTKKVEVNTRDEIGALAQVFNAMQDGIEQRETSMFEQSLTDPITSLPNRQHALALLSEMIGQGYEVGILLIDLGRFQHIRSTLGHKVADEMLRLSTARMKRTLPEDAALARLEGDEFLLVTPVSGVDAALNEAEMVLSLLDSGLSVRKARIGLEVHVGIAMYPEHGNTADDLLRCASLAKQDAIQARTPMKVYQDGKGEAQVRRLKILSDLRVAIDEHQLELHVQPKICMTSGDVVGVEALVRWEHPELGQIMPAEFIPILEESGSICQLTRWVLGEALHHCALWRHESIDMAIAVNLSVQDLKDENLPFAIDQMLLDNGLKPRNLIIEITEEALAQNLESAITVLANLRSRGVRISMDDFGTGYSSLYQLKHLPIDEVKIDREFIYDLPSDTVDVAIVRATIQLATTMGLDVVAEGVESEEAWHFLAREGCKDAQGFLVSKPMPVHSFVNWSQRYIRARYSPIDAGMQLQTVDSAS